MCLRNLIIVLLLSVSFLSCGGGSSSLFGGTWVGRLELTKDTPEGCESDLFVDAEHIVSADGDDVTVNINARSELIGERTSDNSFSAEISQVSAFATFFSSVVYEDVSNDMANVTYVLENSSFSFETGARGCRAEWAGVMTRN